MDHALNVKNSWYLKGILENVLKQIVQMDSI